MNFSSITCNLATKSRNLTSNVKFRGNIVCDKWYGQIVNKRGRADQLAISLLAETVFWHRPHKGAAAGTHKFKEDAWETSYAFLVKKFNSSHQALRRAFVRLEEQNIIKREYRTIIIKGKKLSNVLFIKLNPNYIPAEIININRVTNEAKKKGKTKQQNEVKNISQNTDSISLLSPPPSLQICIDILKNKNIYKNRSSNKSISLKIIDEKENKNTENNQVLKSNLNLSGYIPKGSSINQLNTNNDQISKNRVVKLKRRKFEEFYPISQDDAYELEKLSNRDFSVSYINKLILHLGKKKPNNGFYTKKLFINYMAKILIHEMRDAEQVNKIDFKFKNTNKEIQEQKHDSKIIDQNKYLDEIENSQNISKKAQLKRKIAGRFDSDTAYKILSSCEFIEPDTEKYEDNLGNSQKIKNEKTFSIKTKCELNIDKNQQKLLLEQVKSVYGQSIAGLNFTLIIRSKAEIIHFNKAVNCKESNTIPNADVDKNSVSYKLSKYMIDSIGVHLYNIWFSKVNIIEDKLKKTIIIKTPTSFKADWIKSNYMTYIQQYCRHENYKLLDVIGNDV